MNKKLFYNGHILTMDDENSSVEAVIINGNIIDFVGNYQSALKLIDDNTEIFDLNGRTMLPGFNDSHMHLVSYGLSKYKVDLTKVQSILELQNDLDKYITENKEDIFGDWVLGHGWNHEKFSEKRLPNKEDLDRVINDRPVYLSRACYHIGVLNSKALELLKIDKETPNPGGGKIDKDPVTGEPTGIIRENALYMVSENTSLKANLEDIKNIIQRSIVDANMVGLTSIQSDDFSHIKNYELIIKAYNELKKEGKLNARINLQMLLENKDRLLDFLKLGYKTGDGDEFVKYGPLKLLADGSLGSRTAALKECYSDDSSTNGILIYNDEKIEELIQIAYDNDLQVAVHAIGDRCMNQVLNIYEKLHDDFGEKNLRNRIIHCQIGSMNIFNKFKKLNIIADIQPIFVTTDMHMAEQRVGDERIKFSYAWKTMLDKQIRLSGSSDAPIESFNPLLGVYLATTRKDLNGYPRSGWIPSQKLSLIDSLKLFTTNAAYSSHEEKIKGKIKRGMLADLVILSNNIIDVGVDNIKDLLVDYTLLDGKVIYKR